ncbi:hypothetical protein BC834DRAFT_1044917 [Gloeopeniophorella convolvens]|nr:hypothetical protein BC834DRAFT_1044917 [Gloeopeniophorella convolvens]
MPDRKRPRSEYDAEATRAADLSNHPTFYFDDGNVILRTGKTLFRVHRSVLAHHSDALRALVRPEQGSPQLRNCMLVVLEDEQQEIEVMLQMIYDGMRVDFETITIENWPVVSGLLRTSTKYGLIRVRSDLLRLFVREWPTTLEAYLCKEPTPSSADQKRVVVHPVFVIALLRETGIDDQALLATLFYRLSRHVYQFSDPATKGRLTALAPVDLQRFVFGVAALRTDYARCTLRPTLDVDQAHLGCQTELEQLWSNLIMPTILNTRDLLGSPIEDLEAVKTGLSGRSTSFCPGCRQSLISHYDTLQKTIWDSMALTDYLFDTVIETLYGANLPRLQAFKPVLDPQEIMGVVGG